MFFFQAHDFVGAVGIGRNPNPLEGQEPPVVESPGVGGRLRDINPGDEPNPVPVAEIDLFALDRKEKVPRHRKLAALKMDFFRPNIQPNFIFQGFRGAVDQAFNVEFGVSGVVEKVI